MIKNPGLSVVKGEIKARSIFSFPTTQTGAGADCVEKEEKHCKPIKVSPTQDEDENSFIFV